MATFRDQDMHTGWSRARWLVIAGVVLAVVAAVILIVVFAGGGGSGGGAGY
jgi:hypothetical protein